MSNEQLISINYIASTIAAIYSSPLKHGVLNLKQIHSYSECGLELLEDPDYGDPGIIPLLKTHYSDNNTWKDPPKLLDGNYNVIQFGNHILNKAFNKDKPPKVKDIHYTSSKISQLALDHVKIVNKVMYKENDRIVDPIPPENMNHFRNIMEWSDYLEDLNDELSKGLKEINHQRNSSKFATDPIADYTKISTTLHNAWKLKNLTIITEANNSSAQPYFFMQVHISRLIHYVRLFGTLVLTIPFISPNDIALTLRTLMSMMNSLAKYDSGYMGEGIKGARQCYLYRLETSHIVSDHGELDYMSELSEEKKEAIRIVTDHLGSLPFDNHTKETLCNLYKAVPHADANLDAIYNNILGFKEPNKADPKIVDRFNGTMRKRMFLSLKSAGKDPRIKTESKDPQVIELVTKANSTQVFSSNLETYPASLWSKTEFTTSRKIGDASQIHTRPHDKSSAATGPIEINLLKKALDKYKKGEPIDESTIKCIKPSNDIIASISGNTELQNYGAAKQRFEWIKGLHERFENSQMKKHSYKTIDDIPSDVLADFVSESGANYLVGTEPKLGEFHKKHTRMFYMAERQLKTLTQRCERIAKQCSRYQFGVSITKSYRDRRGDLEQFARIMESHKHMSRKPVFISFDLSEFSKKFPMELVRIYGKILSELTSDQWMKRIDLFFRASIVVHNTRGYFNYTSGVKGGFEGFLNFIWSSIHAVVMEIGIESTGLVGSLLVFSDDGLLYFIPPSDHTKQMITTKILSIKNVYKRLGLEFNMNKTFVSDMMWEYLGDVCYNGHIMPSWLKEASSIGRFIRGKGVTTVADTLDVIIGQFRSCITSGMPSYIGAFLMTYYALKKIIRSTGKVPNEVLHALLITPRSCGGLRIPSIIELVSSSSINAFAEFQADIMLYDKSMPVVSNLVYRFIKKHTCGVTRAADCAIFGYPFKVSGISTSGMRVYNQIIDEIKSRSDLPIQSNPISEGYRPIISAALSNYKNLDITILSTFIHATPAWVDYQSSLSLARASSARSIIPKNIIAKFQRTDTINIKKAVEAWVDEAEEAPVLNFEAKYAIHDLATTVYGENVPYLGKPSIREVSTFDKSDVAVVVRIDTSLFTGSSKISSSYKEPIIRFPSRVTSSGWKAEATGNTTAASSKKLVDTVASITAASPYYYPLLKDLAKISNLELPNVMPAMSSYYRHSTNSRSSSDVMIMPPRFPWAISSLSYIGSTSQSIMNNTRVDRTTYSTLCTAIAAVDWDSIDHPSPVIKENERKIYEYTFNFSSEFLNDMFFPPDVVIDKEAYTSAVEDTINSISKKKVTFAIDDKEVKVAIDEINHATMLENVFIKGDISRPNLKILEAAALNKLTIWVRSIACGGKVGYLPNQCIPMNIVSRANMVKKSVIIGCYLSMDNDERKLIAQSCFSWTAEEEKRMMNMRLNKTTRKYDSHSYKSIPELTYMTEKDDKVVYTNKSQGVWEHYIARVDSMFYSLMQLYHTLFSTLQLGNSTEFRIEVIKILVDHITVHSIIPKTHESIFIANPMSQDPGKISSTSKEVWRRIMTNTLTKIYSDYASAKWNSKDLPREYKVIKNVDNILDVVSVIRPLIRESEHRGSLRPFNTTTARIWMCKFKYASMCIAGMRPSPFQLINEITAITGFPFQYVYPLTVKFIAELESNLQDIKYNTEKSDNFDHNFDEYITIINDSMDNPIVMKIKSIITGRTYNNYNSNSKSHNQKPYSNTGQVDQPTVSTDNDDDFDSYMLDEEAYDSDTDEGVVDDGTSNKAVNILRYMNMVVDTSIREGKHTMSNIINMDATGNYSLYNITCDDVKDSRNIGDDHLHIIADPLLADYSPRLSVVRRYLLHSITDKDDRLDKSQYPGLIADLSSSKINGMLTYFRDKIITPLATRIVTYPSDLLDTIPDLLDSRNNLIEYPKGPNGEIIVYGDFHLSADNWIDLNVKHGSDSMYNLGVLLNTMVSRYMVQNGYSSIGELKTGSAKLTNLLSPYLNRHDGASVNIYDSTSGIPYRSSLNSDAMIVAIKCRSPKNAYNTFLSLTALSDSNCTLARLQDSILVISILKADVIKLERMAPVDIPEESRESFEKIILNSVYSYITSEKVHGTDRFAPDISTIRSVFDTRMHSVGYGRRREVINDDLLAAVFEIYSTVSTNEARLWGLLLFIAKMFNITNYVPILEMIDVINKEMKLRKSHIKHVMGLLGNFLLSYMDARVITLGADIDNKIVDTIKDANPFSGSDSSYDWFVISETSSIKSCTTIEGIMKLMSGLDMSVLRRDNIIDYILSNGTIQLSDRDIQEDKYVNLNINRNNRNNLF